MFVLGMWAACHTGTPAPTPPVPEPVAPAPVAAPTGPVYAIGDLHGDLDNALAVLAIGGLVGPDGHWTGGTATLVQTGDTTDRGPESRQILALLRQLVDEAAAAGGRVVPLLGNHEVMNLRGDWRYVAPEDLAAYGGEAARRAAFAADGEDGRWLRTLGATAKVGDTVFVHGGIHPDHAAGGLDAINDRVRAALDAPDKPDVLGETGPLWYRGYVEEPEEVACPLLSRALETLGAKRMVVGHTTRRDGRVEARCGGSLLVIDIGIADGYGGHLGLVELKPSSDAWAEYPAGEQVDLPDPQLSIGASPP